MDKLIAGPELDEKIAHEIVGAVPCDAWEVVDHGGWHGEAVWAKFGDSACEHEECYPSESPIRYSTNMISAKQLLGKLLEWAAEHATSIALIVDADGYQCVEGGWGHAPVSEDGFETCFLVQQDAFYDTPELAICAAALKYLGKGER